ncbi:MAG: helix-turn-helix domain-containing protein [Ignavibacteria bacterium]|jgi:hypothetical protein|nr:helix-turn-helix domain-containing protein [Ignavibacteria bacterium]
MKDKPKTMNVNITQANPYQEFKLLSINEARKRLGIRRGNLLKLIRDKKLISKIINSKIYVPVQSIITYVNSFDVDEHQADETNIVFTQKGGERVKKHSSLYQTMKSRIKT